MPRTEIKIMKNWEFALEENGEKIFKKIDLPHDWAVTAPFQKDMEQGEAQGFRKRWGVGWYRKNHFLPEKKNGYRYYLDFGGVYENSTVWVNGTEAGGRKYGYSPFRLDITDLVRAGDNEILVRADNTGRPVDRWYSGAGIYRTVKWLELEEKHLDERKVIIQTAREGADGVLTVEPGTDERVRLTVSRKDKTWQTEGQGITLCISIPQAELWSAENPALYDLTLELLDNGRSTDQIRMKIGIREFSFVPGRGMYVNGSPVKLKGVCLHQDVGCRGIAVVQELWRERLRTLKAMGCNCIRTAHHIYAEEFLDLCDEMGFYVYEECFDKWTGGLYGRYFETEWKKDLTCMVERDRNRACIFIWGVGNEVENQAQPSMLSILKMLKEHVVSLDDIRPVTYAMNPHFKRESDIDVSKIEDIQNFVDEADDTEIYDMEERIERIAAIGEIVDIISCNYQEQWYEKIHERMPEKLILGTEVYQFFKGYENQIQNFICENPSLVPENIDYVIGSCIWTGYDYLGESMGYPSKGWSGALIRTNGDKRPSYYLMQSYWSKEPMVYFAVMDYSLADEGTKEHWDIPMYAEHWHFPQFHRTVIPYMIASNCEKVRLFVNDKEYFIPVPAQCHDRMLTGYIPYVPGTVTVIGYDGGKEVCRRTVTTPSYPVQITFDEAECVEISAGEQRMLTVRACDEAGIPCFRDSSLVRFCLEGNGRILAVDSGNLMSSEPYDEDRIHLYHGQASVLVEVGESGGFQISAWAAGMKQGTVKCVVKGGNDDEE